MLHHFSPHHPHFLCAFLTPYYHHTHQPYLILPTYLPLFTRNRLHSTDPLPSPSLTSSCSLPPPITSLSHRPPPLPPLIHSSPHSNRLAVLIYTSSSVFCPFLLPLPFFLHNLSPSFAFHISLSSSIYSRSLFPLYTIFRPSTFAARSPPTSLNLSPPYPPFFSALFPRPIIPHALFLRLLLLLSLSVDGRLFTGSHERAFRVPALSRGHPKGGRNFFRSRWTVEGRPRPHL